MRAAKFLRAIRSPLIGAPTYRVLFLLVVVGVLLICLVPEAALVLPALDAVGLDVVTLLVAFELRHYVLFVARVVGAPASVYLSRCLAVLIAPTRPEMLAYTGMWVLIAVRVLMGSMKASPQAQG